MSEGNPWLEAGTDSILLDDLTLAGRPSVLERLGPASFRSKGFSLIGFLQTLYDHVAEQSNGPAAAPNPEAPAVEAEAPSELMVKSEATPEVETPSRSPFDQPLGI